MIFTKQELNNVKKLCDAVKTKDAVSLKHGDWFYIPTYDEKDLFKFIDLKSDNNSAFVERYVCVARYDYDNDDYKYKIVGPQSTTIDKRLLKHAIVFGSGKEAIQYLAKTAAVKNTRLKSRKDSKVKDGIHKDWLVEHGKRLFEYCKEEDIEAVKSEAENLIKGIDNIMKSRR